MLLIMLDGKFVPIEKAHISVLDHGFLFGNSVYEVIRTKHHTLFAARMHLNRLRYSAETLGIPLPWDDAFLLAEMQCMTQRLAVANCFLRLTITRGVGPLSVDSEKCSQPRRILYGQPMVLPPQELYEKGAHLWVSDRERDACGTVKSGNKLQAVLAKRKASESGCHEALLLTPDGSIAECTSSNIFWVSGGVLHTPDLGAGILKGVTRQLVIHLAEELSLEVIEERMPLQALLEAEEVFITSTSREVMPVSKVGETRFDLGPVTRRLMARFSDFDDIADQF